MAHQAHLAYHHKMYSPRELVPIDMSSAPPLLARTNPCAARYGDCLRNARLFAIIDTTLREGEQLATAAFSTPTKLRISRLLDQLGVEYIEHTSPLASPQSASDLRAICALGLRAKVLTHVRCRMDNVRLAVHCGVQGVNVLLGTSSQLREHSHGLDVESMLKDVREAVGYVKSQGLECRFSAEDAFRSNLVDVLRLYKATEEAGADRVGVADTVECANQLQVYEVVRTVAAAVGGGLKCIP